MKILIIKLGAAGDVVRTTPILRVLNGKVDWLTSEGNLSLLEGISEIEEKIVWGSKDRLRNREYDLVFNLEDSIDVGRVLEGIRYKELFGAFINTSGKLAYTESSQDWFDLSLISRFGKEKADELKLENRRSYQEIIFEGMQQCFKGEAYLLPVAIKADLRGDIAIASKSGSVWPMKNWSYFGELKARLEEDGYIVNYLPIRNTLIEHIGDIQNHRFLISGDSLPMHLALGSGIRCVSIFTCTSPWEIYDYGIQRKIISPDLKKYFYRREFEEAATSSIPLSMVYDAVREELKKVF